MKKYFLDQLLFLTIGIVMAIIIPFLWDSKVATILEIVVIFSWTYLCRRILILPIDFIVGKLTKTVYFSALCRVEPYEFYKGKYCCKWKFYYGSNKTLTLLVPVALTREELSTMPKPDNSAKVRITYFRFSKILLDWDQSGDWTSLSAWDNTGDGSTRQGTVLCKTGDGSVSSQVQDRGRFCVFARERISVTLLLR